MCWGGAVVPKQKCFGPLALVNTAMWLFLPVTDIVALLIKCVVTKIDGNNRAITG